MAPTSAGARTKKMQERIFSKIVILLKNGDFQRSDGYPCHPTSIDMEKIKSRDGKSQRNSVEFTSSMSPDDVKAKLEEAFPYLVNKSFSCAAVVKVNDDQRKFEFHGAPRLWDGITIWKKIGGNSSLYILEEEVETGITQVVSSSSSSDDTGFDEEMDTSSLLCDMQDVIITPDFEQVVLKALHNPTDSAFEGEKDTFCSAEHIFRSLQNLQDPTSKITSETNFSEALNKIASSQGFIISDNQGSGNCMFYALSEQLAAMKGIHISHEALRRRIVHYLEMNPRLPDGRELFNFVCGYPSWADYLRNMLADGTWGDNLILFAAANCFGTSIRVVSLSCDFGVTISPECGDDGGNVLMLGHVNQIHYVSLLPIPEVKSIAPEKGPLEGGYNFTAVLYKELPEDFLSGKADFEGVASVVVQKSSPFSLSGTVPCSHLPGNVNVTFKDQTGTQCIAKGVFCYVDIMSEIIDQLVGDPQEQAVFFAKLSQGYGLLACNRNITQVNGLWNIQHQGQTEQQQSLNVLLQVFYMAAERGAEQFIEMIFSTSAGQVVFNSYKDRTPLPEEVARTNGHEDLAQYLQDVNTRMSKEISSDVTSCAIDWLELVEAAQNQASVAQDKSNQQLKHLCKSDDNLSEYFADAETSSCGSFDLDDNKESTDKEPCTSDGICKPEPSKGPFICEEGSSSKIPVEKIEPADSKEDEGVSKWGFTYSLSEWLNKWRKKEDNSSMPQAAPLDKKVETESSTTKSFLLESLFGKGDASCEATVHQASKTRTAKPKEHGQHNHARSPRKTDPGLKYGGALLVCVLVTVLVGLKLGEGQILHWAVGSGYTRISKLLLHCGLYVDAPGFLKETPLHLASKNGFRDLVDILVQSGGNVNARNFPKQETPLHLAAQNGHQYIAEYLIQHGSKVNIRNVPLQDTPLHLASRNGHGQVVDILLQHGGDVSARNAPSQNTPLHLAAQNGHRQVADILLQRGSDVNARNFPRQESPLHLAARNGHQHIVEFLIQHGGKVNSRNVPWRETPLHFAAQKGHKQVADILVEQGSDVNARNFPRQEFPLHQIIAEFLLQHGSKVNVQNVQGKQTPLHLASRNGHRQVADIILQHGSDVRARSTPLQNTPRHHAAQNGHKQVADILVQQGSEVNAGNFPRQESPLRFVAPFGHQHIVEFQIEHGGKVNSQNVPWRETLHLAAQKGHQRIPEVLMQHGSHVIARNVPWQETCLPLAAQNEHRKVADALLQCDVSPRGSIRQNTPLYLASKDGHTQVADVLIQHGSNVSSRHELDPALLHLLEQNEHKHIAEVLTGNESHLNVEFMSPIHLAAQCRHRDKAEILLKHGSGLNTRNIPLDATFAHLKVKKQHNHASEVFLQGDRKKKYLTNNTPHQLIKDYSDQHVVEVLAAEYNTTRIFNTNAPILIPITPIPVVTKNGNKQPVEVLTHHSSDANLKNKLELSSISLTGRNGHKKGKDQYLVGVQPYHSFSCTLNHYLLKELGISGKNNFVPTTNWKARCRQCKADKKHLTTQPLKDNFEVLFSYAFNIICKTSLRSCKRKRDSSATRWARTRCKNSTQIFNSRKICQKGCCRTSSKWCFMSFSTKKRSTRVHMCLNPLELLSLPFMRNISENWSFYGLICGNTERTVNVDGLMANVLPPRVNSYNHCQPRFTEAIKLFVVIGALLTLCFDVMLFLWKQSFCRKNTSRENSFNEKVYVVPMRSTFKQCQQCDDLQTQHCEAFNKHLCLGDLPMGRACPEELRIERLRSWFTSNLEEELLCVHTEDSLNESDVREVPEPEQENKIQLQCACRNCNSETLCTVYSSGIPRKSPASPFNKILTMCESLMQDICKKLEVSLSSGCPMSFPLQPDNFKYHAFLSYYHDTSNWTEDLMRCLENHVEVSNEDRGKLEFNFGEVWTVLNGSGAIITVCSSKAIQDNGWLCDRCLIDVLAGTQGNISGPLCVQCAKVTNSRGWVIYTEPPSKNRCCRNVKCVGFIGMLKDVTGLSTATKKQGASSSVLSHRVLQAMQWKSGVPSEGELLIIGHQLKNIGDKFEISEDNRRQQSKNETEKDSRNSVKVPTNAIKFFCGNRVKDPWL